MLQNSLEKKNSKPAVLLVIKHRVHNHHGKKYFERLPIIFSWD